MLHLKRLVSLTKFRLLVIITVHLSIDFLLLYFLTSILERVLTSIIVAKMLKHF